MLINLSLLPLLFTPDAPNIPLQSLVHSYCFVLQPPDYIILTLYLTKQKQSAYIAEGSEGRHDTVPWPVYGPILGLIT